MFYVMTLGVDLASLAELFRANMLSMLKKEGKIDDDFTPRKQRFLDNMVFAYQLGAGIGFKISSEVTLDLAYRYFATSDPEFDVVGGGTTEMEYGSHNIIFGVRVAF